jgi:hypothetical protein
MCGRLPLILGSALYCRRIAGVSEVAVSISMLSRNVGGPVSCKSKRWPVMLWISSPGERCSCARLGRRYPGPSQS